MKRTLRMCIIIPSVSPSKPWPVSTLEGAGSLAFPTPRSLSRSLALSATTAATRTFPLHSSIHSAGIWLPFPAQGEGFRKPGPGYLSNRTLGLIHVKQARPINSLITELQHFITQRGRVAGLEKEEREVMEAAVLSTFNLDMSARTLMDLSRRWNDLNVPRMCLTGKVGWGPTALGGKRAVWAFQIRLRWGIFAAWRFAWRRHRGDFNPPTPRRCDV